MNRRSTARLLFTFTLISVTATEVPPTVTVPPAHDRTSMPAGYDAVDRAGEVATCCASIDKSSDRLSSMVFFSSHSVILQPANRYGCAVPAGWKGLFTSRVKDPPAAPNSDVPSALVCV